MSELYFDIHAAAKERERLQKENESLRSEWGLKEIERHNEEKFKWAANMRADFAEHHAEVLASALQRYVTHFGDPLRCARPALDQWLAWRVDSSVHSTKPNGPQVQVLPSATNSEE